MRSGLIVSAVGDIGEAELARQLDRTFGGLAVGVVPPLPPEWKPPTKPRTIVVERKISRRIIPAANRPTRTAAG